jgi:hypothetical protein
MEREMKNAKNNSMLEYLLFSSLQCFLESVKEGTFMYQMGKNYGDRLENLNGRSHLENVGWTGAKY